MISVLVTIVALSCDVLGYDPNLHQASWCWIDPEAPNPLFWTFFTGKAWELSASVLTLGLYSAIKLHLFRHKAGLKHQALVYDILPSTTAVFSYAIESKFLSIETIKLYCIVLYCIGSRKLSANEQFFVGAQTIVSLLQTTQIISDVCFNTDYVAYAN